MYKSSISKASSYGEIGEFWDTHSVADYWELTEPCEFEIKLPLSSRVGRCGMTVQEALDQRIEKIRLPDWAEGSYVSFDFLEDDTYGPWAHVKDPSGEEDVLVFELARCKLAVWEEFQEDV